MLRKGLHHSIHLQRAWNKHGEASFMFEVLECCDKNILIKKEQQYLDAISLKYNMCPTAGNRLGTSWSATTRLKISKNRNPLRGDKHPGFGKPLSQEWKDKIPIKVKKTKNPMYKKSVKDILIKKYGVDEAEHRWHEINIKRSINGIGKGTKVVIQKTKMDEFVCEFPSLTEASNATGISISNINRVCLKKGNTAGDYKWEYKH